MRRCGCFATRRCEVLEPQGAFYLYIRVAGVVGERSGARNDASRGGCSRRRTSPSCPAPRSVRRSGFAFPMRRRRNRCMEGVRRIIAARISSACSECCSRVTPHARVLTRVSRRRCNKIATRLKERAREDRRSARAAGRSTGRGPIQVGPRHRHPVGAAVHIGEERRHVRLRRDRGESMARGSFSTSPVGTSTASRSRCGLTCAGCRRCRCPRRSKTRT